MVNKSRIQIALVNTTDGFHALKDEWNNLQDISTENNPFQSHEWLQTWWEVHGHGNLQIYTFHNSDSGELVGVLPLFSCRAGGLLSVKMLRFMGSEKVSSDFLGCVAQSGMEYEVYCACLEALQRDSKQWDVIELQDMDEDSSFCKFMINAGFPGMEVDKDPGKCCPYLNLPDSWEILLKNLSTKMRQRVGYYRRALEKKGTVEFEQITDSADLDEAFADIVRLRQDRMEQKGITTAKITDAYQTFHSELMPRFLDGGRLRLYFLRFDGQRIAYLYLFAGGTSIYFYQTGFDRAWSSQSVGFVLLGMVIERSINDGITTFEFLRGDERYKYEWGEVGRKPLVTTKFYRNSVRGAFWRLRNDMIKIAGSSKRYILSLHHKLEQRS